jgi:hypothetical protein
MKNGILLLVLLQQEYTSVLLPETTKTADDFVEIMTKDMHFATL